MRNDFIFYNKASGTDYDFFNSLISFINGEDKDIILKSIEKIVNFATRYDLSGNIWKQYIAYLLIKDVNVFTKAHQRRNIRSSTILNIATHDLKIFYDFFNYDFLSLDDALKTNIFSFITNYRGINVKNTYLKEVKNKISSFSSLLDKSNNFDDFIATVQKFYHQYGCGDMAFYTSFRLECNNGDNIRLVPNFAFKKVRYTDIIGYESQKNLVKGNTRKFISQSRANNVLLYGESGTGKSETIKATVNQFSSQGLRMIEVYRSQFNLIPSLCDMLQEFNYKFILYLDDLSFDKNETEYKYLKAVIEGARDSRNLNVLIYATSNRRTLIQETYSDSQDYRVDEDIHKSETKEEKHSLSNRFGLSIYYPRPKENEFFDIVKSLAKKKNIKINDEELVNRARIWQAENSGLSGRSATQFIDSL